MRKRVAVGLSFALVMAAVTVVTFYDPPILPFAGNYPVAFEETIDGGNELRRWRYSETDIAGLMDKVRGGPHAAWHSHGAGERQTWSYGMLDDGGQIVIERIQRFPVVLPLAATRPEVPGAAKTLILERKKTTWGERLRVWITGARRFE